MKYVKLAGIILLLPVAVALVLVLLVFILGLSPFLTICFTVWQIRGYFSDRLEMELKFKQNTNKNYLLAKIKMKNSKI